MNCIGRYFLNQAIALDQLLNVWFGGAPDETISSRIGRIKKANNGTVPWRRTLTKIIDVGLDRMDKNHCVKSIEADELEQTRKESVIDGKTGT